MAILLEHRRVFTRCVTRMYVVSLPGIYCLCNHMIVLTGVKLIQTKSLVVVHTYHGSFIVVYVWSWSTEATFKMSVNSLPENAPIMAFVILIIVLSDRVCISFSNVNYTNESFFVLETT